MKLFTHINDNILHQATVADFTNCLKAAASTAAAGHIAMPARAAPQRHLANRHALRVSESDSYALLFLLCNQRTLNDLSVA